MSRNNRLIQLVFNDIIANQDRIGAMEQFLATDSDLNIKETEDIKRYKELYKQLVIELSSPFEELARIEEMIVQLRCLEMMPKEIKFYMSREYVYARTLFYRSNMEIKDIRVMVGRLDEFEEPFEILVEYPEFRMLAENKLRDAILKEIKSSESIINFHSENLAVSE